MGKYPAFREPCSRGKKIANMSVIKTDRDKEGKASGSAADCGLFTDITPDMVSPALRRIHKLSFEDLVASSSGR